VPCRTSLPGKVDPPPEASVALGASNPHGEAYTASPKALLLSPEIELIAGAFVFALPGATATFRNGLESGSDRGRWNKSKRTIEDSRELGRSCDFLLKSRWEPGEHFQPPFVYEKAAQRHIIHKQGIAKRRKTKCGEMNRRKSECLNSTGEIGELYNPEESREGSKASEF